MLHGSAANARPRQGACQGAKQQALAQTCPMGLWGALRAGGTFPAMTNLPKADAFLRTSQVPYAHLFGQTYHDVSLRPTCAVWGASAYFQAEG